MPKGNMSISISPDEIMGVEIGKSADYKYARVGCKKGDKEYCSVSYEWSGDIIPEFVMGLMDWVKANQEEIDKSKTEKAAEYTEFKEKK